MATDRAREIATRLGIDQVVEPVAVTSGLGGTELWRLRRAAGHDDLLLRLFPAGSPDVVAEREAAAHARAADRGVGTPLILDRDRIQDRPVLVMAWVDGTTVSTALWSGADPDDLGRRCGQVLARIHRVDAAEVRRRAAVIGERDWVGWAGARAERLAPLLRGFDDHRLLHLDFHPDNLMLAGDQIVVLDWANVRVGPAAADLARTASIIDLVRSGGHPAIGERERDLVATFGDALLAGYADQGGRIAVPAAIRAWATAVQLADSTASWVTADYRDRLLRRWDRELRSS